MGNDDFYDEQFEASEIKTRIITKYFRFWTKVMVPLVKKRGKRLAYFDLYAGPGRFEDGTKSTPILILEDAVANPDLCKMLVTEFNDKDIEHVKALEKNIHSIEGIDRLKYEPGFLNLSVDDNFESLFSDLALIPSFSFIDPFGYKGVTLRLLHGMLKDWGCDLVLFFSYSRINAAIDNPTVEDHVLKLFGGADRIEQLREDILGRLPSEREALILEAFSQALGEMGFDYVHPFTFKRSDQKRTSHHLIFITKHKLGYTVMKEIMAAESSEENQGVVTFTYTRSLSRDETPLLYLLDRPLDDLGEMLLTEFAGQSLTMEGVFDRHNVGKPYVKRNYKAALIQLEVDGRIEAEPPISKRPQRKGESTFADRVLVKFPDGAED